MSGDGGHARNESDTDSDCVIVEYDKERKIPVASSCKRARSVTAQTKGCNKASGSATVVFKTEGGASKRQKTESDHALSNMPGEKVFRCEGEMELPCG